MNNINFLSSFVTNKTRFKIYLNMVLKLIEIKSVKFNMTPY